MTAHENVALGVDSAFGKLSSFARKRIVDEQLALVGLAAHTERRASELSLGMRQRVGLARAFALDPKMLLLDEPFGMLDSITRMELQEVLIELWARDRKTALMVTHDVDEALFLSDRIVMMTSGPSATIGGVLEVPFERPRERIALLADSRYQELRDQLIGFLEKEHRPNEAARLAS